MSKIISYPSIQTIDLNNARSWKDHDNYKYYIEEKIDGSQLSIMTNQGKLVFYNKNKIAGENNAAFTNSVSMLRFKFENKSILNPSFIYHGESVCKIKHNVNVYHRTPVNYFILYDIYDLESRTYLSSEMKIAESERIGMECVPIIYTNSDPDQSPYTKCEDIIKLIEEGKIESVLGGTPEGIVLKHHAFEQNGKTVSTKLKYVTDTFKERHAVKQPKTELTADDFINRLGASFNTEARFHKAAQHLSESDQINLDSLKPSDLHKIVNELNSDFDKEYREEMMLTLWLEFGPVLKKLARENTSTRFDSLIKSKAI